MNKNFRQGQILKLIGARQLHTQEEVARALKRLGVQATQVTLSRDLRELGLVKTAQGYARSVGAAPIGPDITTVAREFLIDVRVAENLLVLLTPSGSANSLAEALDNAEWPEVVGTIAGDNTVLVIAPNASTAQSLRWKLLKLLAGL